MSSNYDESENDKLEYSLKDKERIKIMADFEELSFSYLGLLSNAHHDGTTQQIDDCCGNLVAGTDSGYDGSYDSGTCPHG